MPSERCKYCIHLLAIDHGNVDGVFSSSCPPDEQQIKNETRKGKTEAVLQRRSMLKLGVICKFMNRYGKCFMS